MTLRVRIAAMEAELGRVLTDASLRPELRGGGIPQLYGTDIRDVSRVPGEVGGPIARAVGLSISEPLTQRRGGGL